MSYQIFISDIDKLQSLGATTMPDVGQSMRKSAQELAHVVLPGSAFPTFGGDCAAAYERARVAVQDALLNSAKNVDSCGDTIAAIAEHWRTLEEQLAGGGGS